MSQHHHQARPHYAAPARGPAPRPDLGTSARVSRPNPNPSSCAKVLRVLRSDWLPGGQRAYAEPTTVSRLFFRIFLLSSILGANYLELSKLIMGLHLRKRARACCLSRGLELCPMSPSDAHRLQSVRRHVSVYLSSGRHVSVYLSSGCGRCCCGRYCCCRSCCGFAPPRDPRSFGFRSLDWSRDWSL